MRGGHSFTAVKGTLKSPKARPVLRSGLPSISSALGWTFWLYDQFLPGRPVDHIPGTHFGQYVTTLTEISQTTSKPREASKTEPLLIHFHFP